MPANNINTKETPNESITNKKQNPDNLYKNNIKSTFKNPMDVFRKSRIDDHKRFLLREDPKTIEKIKSLFKNIKIEKDSDKRVITLNLKNKYTIIEPNLNKISDEIYNRDINMYRIEPSFTHYVNIQWTRWNIKQRSNKPLQEYAKKMKDDWYNIPTKNETDSIFKEIWEMAGLDDKILMDVFICLTGLRGNYLLKSSEKNRTWEKTLSLWPISWYESVDWDYPIKLFFLKKW